MNATKYWKVEATMTMPPEKAGETIRAVCESYDLQTEDQARWFGAGQLRGMGFVVKDVQVTEQVGEGRE